MAEITSDSVFDAVSILIDKKLETMKFDETISAKIVNDTNSSKGEYTILIDNVKCKAYSASVDYRNDDMVMVTVPQGNYDNQKIIIGKCVKDNNIPMSYKSPFSYFINLTGNLLAKNTNTYSLTANKEWIECLIEKGNELPSDSDTVQYYIKDDEQYVPITSWEINNNKDIIVYKKLISVKHINNLKYQNYTRLGVQAQFCSWLGDYDTVEGHYGLSLILTLQSLADSSQITNVVLDFNSNDFIGNIYDFQTYYTQQGVFDISKYAKDYKITNIEIQFYQGNDFKDSSGYPIPSEPNNIFESTIGPNLFVKDIFIALGIDAVDFVEDEVLLYSDNKLNYAKYPNVSNRNAYNQKLAIARWIHKDEENNEIYSLSFDDEVPDKYEIRWYHKRIGASSPDVFAGAHWERYYGQSDYVNDNNGDWLQDETNDNATNKYQVKFQPNVNNQTEELKVIILKNENNQERFIAASNLLTFTNDDEVRNKQTIIDTNALSIRYDDDEKGHYFLYNEAGDIGKNEDKEIRTLTAVFGDNVNNINEKLALNVQDCSFIKWTFPTENTMIVPMDNGVPATADFSPEMVNQVNFTIKSHLNNNATNNTIRLDIIKDGLNYSAQVQPIFGTAGDNGSDYKLILTWRDGKNALNLSQGFDDTLTGDVELFDQAGDIVDWPSGATLKADWLVAEVEGETFRKKEEETADYFYPVFNTISNGNNQYDGVLYSNNNNTNDPDYEYQKSGYYYFFDNESKDNQQNPAHIYYSYDIINQKFTNIKRYNGNIPIYYEWNDHDDDDNPIQLYRKKLTNETKNKLEYRKVIFSSDPLNQETGKVSYTDPPIGIEYDNQTHSYKKTYGYSQIKRYFIKINDQYILDPWLDYQEAETYFEPIEAKEKIYTYDKNNNIKNSQNKALKAVVENNTVVKITAGNSVTMNSLFILRLTLSNFGDYDLVTYYPIALKNGEIQTVIDNQIQQTKIIQYIEGPDRVRYSSAGETDFNKNPYQITILKYESNNMVKYRHGYGDYKFQLVTSAEEFAGIETIYNENHILQNPKPDSFIENTYYQKVLITSNPSYNLNGYWRLLFVNDNNKEDFFKPILKETGIVLKNNKYDLPLLNPISVYIPDALPYGIQFVEIGENNTETVLWTQPILVYENKYPSATLNKWNGKDIETDDKAGTITASGFAAGRKERDNTFTGVVIGDWSRSATDVAVTKNTGIYGFNRGAISYAFKDDGTGFIGKDGSGRIFFDGENSQIFSSRWVNKNNSPQGMLLDIDDGYIKMQKDSNYITLGSNQTTYPLSIGTNKIVESRKFKVKWDGSLYATDAYFDGNGHFEGDIEADSGQIGGWTINQSQLSSPDNQTFLYSRPGDQNANIKTNVIDIVGIGSWNGKTARFGTVQGLDIEGNTTYGLGITSSNAPLIFYTTSANTALRSAADTYLEGGCNFAQNNNSVASRIRADDNGQLIFDSSANLDNNNNTNLREIVFRCCKLHHELSTNSSERKEVLIMGIDIDDENEAEAYIKCNAPAKNQHGIYARFA